MTITSKTVKKVPVSWTTKSGEKRAAVRWQARFRDPVTDRQHSKNFDRKVDAEAWLNEQISATVTGRYVDPKSGRVSLQVYYDDWKERQLWKASTRENADLAVGCCTFKETPLNAVRRSHVEAWVKAMDDTLAASTIDTRVTIVRGILRAAVADRLIAEDPSAGVKLPQKPKAEAAMVIPTPEVVGRLLHQADQKKRRSTRVGFRAYVAVCAFAGLRRAEAAGLQVADIDFLRRSLRVDRQIQTARAKDLERGENLAEATGGTVVVVTPPKAGSRRTVYLPDQLLEILSEHLAEGHAPGDGSERWLFADSEGRPWHANAVEWRWRATRTDAGATTLRLHHLRHFYASGLIASGCDVVTVANAMGHASTATTHKTYLHLWHSAEDRTRVAADALARQTLATVHEPCTEEPIQG